MHPPLQALMIENQLRSEIDSLKTSRARLATRLHSIEERNADDHEEMRKLKVTIIPFHSSTCSDNRHSILSLVFLTFDGAWISTFRTSFVGRMLLGFLMG